MARIRSIKPEFFTSLVIADLPLSARLTFVGLWTYADDNGVGIDDARLIRAAVWPLEEAPDILQRTREDLQSLQTAGLITRYEHSGKPLLAIKNWSEHQKVSHPGKPRYPRPEQLPPPPDTPTDLPSCDPPEASGEAPEDLPRPPEILGPEQGAGSREQGAGKNTPPTPPASGETPASGFDDFWQAYPRKVGKAEALKAWTKALKSGAEPANVIAAAVRHHEYHQRRATEPRFIPHASTWLNGRRYDDPPEPEAADSPSRPPLRAVSGGDWQPYRNPTDPSVYENGF